MSFHIIVDKYRQSAISEVEKGMRFERLMAGYLQTDPTYSSQFHKIWLWHDFPYREEFGGHDTGIDLVALTNEDEYWAIQCKCYQEGTTIEKKTVDSFLATSSRHFLAENGEDLSFSRRLWISTTNTWSKNAEEVLQNQNPPVTRINLSDLETAPVDWEKLHDGVFGTSARSEKKSPYPHQLNAIAKVHEYFKTADRGKLIMACGTGKTYTALKIAEQETDGLGFILVLVPSIALISQTLREWCAEAEKPIQAICICSDATVSRQRSHSQENDSFDGISLVDLALPASTNVETALRHLEHLQIHTKQSDAGMTVIFSTYQSIEVVHDVQQQLEMAFDLIICDEAHRTTGVTLADEEESAFVKVHDNAFLVAKKRMYMTATPRLFREGSKKKAELSNAILCSMDDESLYGKEMYRLGFGHAVDEGLLTDYKVLVLTLSKTDIPPSVQRMARNPDESINADDASKLIGCVNALSKRILGDNGIIQKTDPQPMKRAVAFCREISVSKAISEYLNEVPAQYISDLPLNQQAQMVKVTAKHIDGTMKATSRDGLLQWLKGESSPVQSSPVTSAGF